jgi:dTDP-6-deoxy-L-talose 4-dehydrogenase (NAD+)
MKVLVTGATGFIGNYVISNLLNRGIDVVATSSNIEKAMMYEWFSKVKFIEHNIFDLNREDNLFEYFDKPDRTIHLAWKGLPNYKKTFHFEENLFSHYFFLKNLLENGLSNLTVAGTCFEYGLQEGCLSEELATNPSNSYAIAKDTLRKFLTQLEKELSFNLKWARLFYIYGEGQGDTSLISQLDKAIDSGASIFNMSWGEQQRDYLKVTEVAHRLTKIALQDKVTGIINCCGGSPIKIKEFVRQYLEETNKKIELNLGYYKYSELEPMNFWGDITKYKTIK